MKDEKIEIRISKSEKANLVAVAEHFEIPASQIVRKALKREVAEMTEQIETEKESALAKWKQ